MAEYVEVAGPSGPLMLELTDAALSEFGRAGAITAAMASANAPTDAPLPADDEETD
jgi:hypothetical protein